MASLKRVVLAILGALLLLWPLPSRGQEPERIGTVLVVEGVAEVRAQGGTTWEQLRFRDAIFLNDTVRTGEESKVKILLQDDSIMTLGERSQMQFTAFLVTPQRRRSVVNLLLGKLRVLTTRFFGGGSRTEIHTANTVVGVRGSEGITEYQAAVRKTTVLPLSGEWFVQDPTNPQKIIDLPVNQITELVGPTFTPQTRPVTPQEKAQLLSATSTAPAQVDEEVKPTETLQQEPARPPRGAEGPPPEKPASAMVSTQPLRETAAPSPPELTEEVRALPVVGGTSAAGGDDPQTVTVTPDTSPTAEEVIRKTLLRLTIKIPKRLQ